MNDTGLGEVGQAGLRIDDEGQCDGAVATGSSGGGERGSSG